MLFQLNEAPSYFLKLGAGANRPTHTTQSPTCSSMMITDKGDSTTYRSANDPSDHSTRQCLLVDTPGHGKLRYHALDRLANPDSISGVIHCVDASNLSTEVGGIHEAASYLYVVLLKLQSHAGLLHKSKARRMPVLIAANKMDLFTAVPLAKLQSDLETEIARFRASTSRGLLDSAVHETMYLGGEQGWLGGSGKPDFTFSQLQELNIDVTVLEGSAAGENGANVSQWRDWVEANVL